jgi:hypothetical protein
MWMYCVCVLKHVCVRACACSVSVCDHVYVWVGLGVYCVCGWLCMYFSPVLCRVFSEVFRENVDIFHSPEGKEFLSSCLNCLTNLLYRNDTNRQTFYHLQGMTARHSTTYKVWPQPPDILPPTRYDPNRQTFYHLQGMEQGWGGGYGKSTSIRSYFLYHFTVCSLW